MYVIQNAWKSISRNLARNLLLCFITLIIAVAVCVALSIREAAEATKHDTLASLSVTAQISYDRTQAMQDMQNEMGDLSEEELSEGKVFSFDFEALQGQNLSLDDYMNYAQALSSDDSYYYSTTAALNAGEGIEPYGEDSSSDSDDSASSESSETEERSMGNMMGGGMGAMEEIAGTQGDFSLTGYSSYDAMTSLFGTDGTHTIEDGQMFEAAGADMTCVISNELALQNNLEVGDTISLANPTVETDTHELTICGIYSDSSSGSQQQGPMRMMSDQANNLYASYETVQAIITNSKTAVENESISDSEEEVESISGTISFTYVFASSDNYYLFEETVNEMGLEENYIVSSTDLTSFENSLVPLESLSTMAGWFLIVVLVVGGVILIGISVLNLRERKYEIGVLTAIGMKKGKVALQFIIEAFIVTLVGILVGAMIGACASVPVTNELLASQIESNQSSNNQLSMNFGFDGEDAQMPEGSVLGDGSSSMSGGRGSLVTRDAMGAQIDYVDSVTSATNLLVIVQLLGIGLLLTIVSSLAAMITIMRYDPLKILSSRS